MNVVCCKSTILPGFHDFFFLFRKNSSQTNTPVKIAPNILKCRADPPISQHSTESVYVRLSPHCDRKYPLGGRSGRVAAFTLNCVHLMKWYCIVLGPMSANQIYQNKRNEADQWFISHYPYNYGFYFLFGLELCRFMVSNAYENPTNKSSRNSNLSDSGWSAHEWNARLQFRRQALVVGLLGAV